MMIVTGLSHQQLLPLLLYYSSSNFKRRKIFVSKREMLMILIFKINYFGEQIFQNMLWTYSLYKLYIVISIMLHVSSFPMYSHISVWVGINDYIYCIYKYIWFAFFIFLGCLSDGLSISINICWFPLLYYVIKIISSPINRYKLR